MFNYQRVKFQSRPDDIERSRSKYKKSRASRSAEVSSYTKRIAIGPQKQVLPIGAAAESHSFATLFSEFAVILRHPFSVVTTTSQLFSDHLSSSQFLQLCATSSKLFPPPFSAQLFHLFPALPNTSQRLSPLPTLPSLFSTCLNSSHLLPPPQLFPPLLTSAQLISPLSQLISNLLTFSTLANSSQLSSPPVTEMLTHRANLYTEKHLQFYTQQAFTHSKLLHRETFTQKAFTQRSFYAKQAVAQRNFYT